MQYISLQKYSIWNKQSNLVTDTHSLHLIIFLIKKNNYKVIIIIIFLKYKNLFRIISNHVCNTLSVSVKIHCTEVFEQSNKCKCEISKFIYRFWKISVHLTLLYNLKFAYILKQTNKQKKSNIINIMV